MHTCLPSDNFQSIDSIIIKPSMGVCVEVDYTRRGRVAPNHTMTHVLNWVLRKTIVGGSIDQRGSAVSEDKLRFVLHSVLYCLIQKSPNWPDLILVLIDHSRSRSSSR